MIKYIDRSYDEKRKILRQYHFNNINAAELVNYVIYHTEDCKTFQNGLMYKEDILRTLLIDGYVAYEKVFDNSQKRIIAYQQLDPITLTLSLGSTSGKPIWVQYQDKPNMKRLLNEEQVVYMSYSTNWDGAGHTSLVEQIMEFGLNKKEHETFIDLLIDNVYKVYSMFDKDFERRAKLERILK